MKGIKRFGAALITLLALAAVLTGTALAAGPGDGISVQLNGKPVAFTDAVPEFSGERTFVPLRAVLEAMEARVDYDSASDTVNIYRSNVTLTMILGQNTAIVTEDGQTRTITMDVVPYVKNDRTYVPVRFVAEAFGCSVGWDRDTQTVIIVDIDALFGDATFDLMDNFAAYCAKQEKNQNMAMTGTLALDMEDKSGETLPKPVSARGAIDGVTGDKGLQMNWNLKLSGLSELAAGGGSPMEQLLMQQLLSALSDLKGEVRMDVESGMLYLSVPAELTGGSGDTWYSVDLAAYQAELLSALDITQLTQLKDDAGIREALTAVLKSFPLDNSEADYDALALMTSIYVDMLSDQAFTQKGNTYVAEMTLEDVVDLTVTLTKKGDDIVAADIRMGCDVTEDGVKVTMTLTEHAAPDKITVEMKMEMSDSTMSFKLNMDIKGAPTSKAPVTAPPAGAAVVPMS